MQQAIVLGLQTKRAVCMLTGAILVHAWKLECRARPLGSLHQSCSCALTRVWDQDLVTEISWRLRESSGTSVPRLRACQFCSAGVPRCTHGRAWMTAAFHLTRGVPNIGLAVKMMLR
jgi:hypothetical protein